MDIVILYIILRPDAKVFAYGVQFIVVQLEVAGCAAVHVKENTPRAFDFRQLSFSTRNFLDRIYEHRLASRNAGHFEMPEPQFLVPSHNIRHIEIVSIVRNNKVRIKFHELTMQRNQHGFLVIVEH